MALSTRTALSFWNAAVRDFPQSTIDALYAGEAWDLCNRAVRAVAHETYPVYHRRYMTEAVLTQVSDEIDLSQLPVQYGGWERLIEIETTIANAQRLLTSQNANKQGPFDTPLNSGDNWVYLPSAMPDMNWIFDVLSVSQGSYAIIEREIGRFKINVTEDCILTWAVARTGAVTTEVLTTMGANLQEISITKEVSVALGDNIIGFGGVELLDGYTVYPPIIASGTFSYEVTEYKPSYIVVNVVGGTGKLHIEIKGQAIVNGTLLSSLVELRGIKQLTTGNNSIVFADAGVSSVENYIFASLFNYNQSGTVSYEIISTSPTGFTIHIADESSTLLWRIVQQGITLSGQVSGWKKRMCFAKQWAEFNVWNTDAKHHQYSIVYHLTGDESGGMKILLKKGYGLAHWQSFIIRYPRLPLEISGATSTVDLLEGLQMELGILLLRWMVAHRSTEHLELRKLVETLPVQIQDILIKIYQTANLQYDGGQRLLKKAA